MSEEPVWRHAGRYSSKKSAEEYAQFIHNEGYEVEILPVTVYDVFTLEKKAIH